MSHSPTPVRAAEDLTRGAPGPGRGRFTRQSPVFLVIGGSWLALMVLLAALGPRVLRLAAERTAGGWLPVKRT